MLIRRINPTTGQEEVVEDGRADVPSPLAPVEATVGPDEPTRALDFARAQDQTLSIPALEGMPPVRDPKDLESAKVNQDTVLSRFGGPKPQDLAGKGFWGSLGEFASSDLGRNMIGALGVGLAGIRNPRDGGRLQEQLMQMHFQGVKERQTRREQGEAMTGLWDAMSEASTLIAKNDLEGASGVISKLARNRYVMQNPVAMGELLKLQSQINQRTSNRAGLKALTEGPDITSGMDLLRRGGEAGMDPEMIAKLGPVLMKDTKPSFHFDSASQSVVLAYPDGRVVVKRYGEGDLPLTLKDINAIADVDTQRHLTRKLGEHGIAYPTFIKAYNGQLGGSSAEKAQNRQEAIGVLTWASSQPKESTSQGGVSEKLSRAKAAYEKNPTPATKEALKVAQGAYDNEVGLVRAKKEATLQETREEARNQPVREFLKAGGGIFELKSGQYKEVSNKFKTKGEAEDAEARGEVSIVPDRVGAEDIQKKKNSLSTLQDIREIGERVFTKESTLQIAKQGVTAWVKGLTGQGELGRDVRKLKVMQATVFDIAKGLGNDARISDADAKFALNAMSIDTLFQSGLSFRESIDLVQKIFRRGLERSARNERAPESENIVAEYMKSKGVAGTMKTSTGETLKVPQIGR